MGKKKILAEHFERQYKLIRDDWADGNCLDIGFPQMYWEALELGYDEPETFQLWKCKHRREWYANDSNGEGMF